MSDSADALSRVLIRFLIGGWIVLACLLAVLVGLRVSRSLLLARQHVLRNRYRLTVEAVLVGEPVWQRVRRRHRRLVGGMLLAALTSVGGEPVDRARAFAGWLGLLDLWRADVTGHRWWRRANAARALGLVRDTETFAGLTSLLDDDDEEVRAAAVGALGRLGDCRAASELLRRLDAQSRHQRVRIVEALKGLGAGAGDDILQCVRQRVDLLPLLEGVFATAVGSRAVDDLVGWLDDARSDVRAAALHALGSVGLDARTYYHVLKRLTDADAPVRAMAARALGRSGRPEAAGYLAPRLDDEWNVAAESVRALALLGEAGRDVLRRRAPGLDQAAMLSRRALWAETTARPAVPSFGHHAGIDEIGASPA